MSLDQNGNTLIVSAGPWRIALLAPLLILCAILFYGFAAVLLFVDPGNWLGKFAMVVIALVMIAMATYFLLIVSSLAFRVEVAAERLHVRVPNWRGGVMPWRPWIRAELPYLEIGAVESRDEVYSSFGITTIQTAYSFATRDGRRIVLGYTSPIATWNYAFPEASALIAQRAHVTAKDLGAVYVGGVIRSLIKGLPGWDAKPMAPEEREKTRGKAALAMQMAFALVVIVLSIRACAPHQ